MKVQITLLMFVSLLLGFVITDAQGAARPRIIKSDDWDWPSDTVSVDTTAPS